MLTNSNTESWQDIRKFIEDLPETEYWLRWQPMAREVITILETKGLAAHFRIGQSVTHVIFSTLEHHGLCDEPRVTLEFDPEAQQVRVAYSRANLWFDAAETEERIDLASAVPCVLQYLRRLWSETRSDVQVPDPLKAV